MQCNPSTHVLAQRRWEGLRCIPIDDLARRKGGYYKLLQERDQPNTILIGLGHIEEPLTQTGPYGFRRREIGPTEVIRESPEHYAITLGKPLRIRHATELEWNNADPLLTFASSADKAHNYFDRYEGSDRKTYVYAGRSFPKSGPHWALHADSRLSGDAQYLTVNSWDGKGEGATDWWPTPSFDNTGQYWIDLYEVGTGRRLIAITGKTHDVPRDFFLEGAQWFGKHYFILPLSERLDPFLVCDVDALR